MKFKLSSKKEKPNFKYLVKALANEDYYLYNDFDKAINKLRALSLCEHSVSALYEAEVNPRTGEFHGVATFQSYGGTLRYDKHARLDLHMHYYINAGEWLNPDEL